MAVAGKPVNKFTLDLRKFTEKIELEIGVVRRKVALDLFEKMVRRTPVDTGRLRASWFLSDDQPSTEIATAGKRSADAATVAALSDNVGADSKEPFGVTWVVNNLPYVLPIEFEGHSKQAPAGMVRVSLAEIEAELRGVVELL